MSIPAPPILDTPGRSLPEVSGRGVSVGERMAIIEEHLTALAAVPAPERAQGDHLAWSHRMLGLHRRVEALTASSLDAMACSGQWSTAGGRSAAAWLTGSTTEAADVVTTLLANGAFTRGHRLLEEAAAAGEVSSAHVTVWRLVRRKYARIGLLLDAAEDHILRWAQELSPKGFTASLVEFAHRLDPDLVDDIDAKNRRRVFLDAVVTLDGDVHVSGLLDPVTGSLLIQALESARKAGITADAEDDAEDDAETVVDPPEDPHADPARAGRSISERNPEALRRLLDLACAATGPDGLPAINASRPKISIHIDADDLVSSPTAAGTEPGATEPGAPGMGWLHRFGIPTAAITARFTRAVACDATLAPLIVDRSGQITAVLPATRTIAPALRTAILTRDEHCRFPDCVARIDEVHHITYFSHGGPTTRDNLVGLCYHHHQLIHKHGWRITGDPDGQLHFAHHGHYTPEPTAPPKTPAGLAARQRKRQAEQAARELLTNPRLNPNRRYTLLERERNQPEEPPF